MVRHLAFALCGLIALSCREIEPLGTERPEITGYALSGTVTSVGGTPIDSAVVRLWYNFASSGTPPIDTSHVVVTDPTKIVDVSVLTPEGEFVRQLYLSYRPAGPVPRFQWDYYDAEGNFVPSGLYLVRIAFDTVVVKTERRIVQGTPTAATDLRGVFSIGASRLPIGDVFDMYSVQNQYMGTYAVLPMIDMEFHKTGLFGAASVTLQLNRLTTAAFTVQ